VFLGRLGYCVYMITKDHTKVTTFSDLVFSQHRGFAHGKAIQAQLNFGSIFTISVVQNTEDGTGLYGHRDDNTYEVAMWVDGSDDMIPLGINDDVLAGQAPVTISRLMKTAMTDGLAWVNLLKKLKEDHRKELGLDD